MNTASRSSSVFRSITGNSPRALPSGKAGAVQTGLPAGYVLTRGDYLAFTCSGVRALHRIVTNTVSANGAGTTGTFEVTPRIRAGASVGLAVTLVKAACKAVLVPGSVNKGRSRKTITREMAFRFSQSGIRAAQLHRAFFDPMSGNLIEAPQRVWKGWVDTAPIHTAPIHTAPIHTPEAGGEATAELTLVSAARALTRNSSLVKSDAVQRQRGGDRMRRFQDVSGAVSVWWGSKRT